MTATTKRELVKRVAEKTGLKQSVAKEVIQTFLDEVIRELALGHRLEFREFGVFHTIQKRPRKARNPRTGAEVFVPAKAVVHFKVGRLMKEKVKKLAERQEMSQTADPPKPSLSKK